MTKKTAQKTAPAVAKWIDDAVTATHGNLSRIGCIFLATLDGDTRDAMRRKHGLGPHPAFASCATVTSDGFLMAGFIDKDGEGHHGAFVGSFADLKANVLGLASHLKLKGDDREAFLKSFRGWISTDYRSNAETF